MTELPPDTDNQANAYARGQPSGFFWLRTL